MIRHLFPLHSARLVLAATESHGLRYALVLAISATLLAGCAAQPGADLPTFGDSVRHMKEMQTYSPGDEITPLRGDKAAEAMRAYRQGGGTRQGGMSPALP